MCISAQHPTPPPPPPPPESPPEGWARGAVKQRILSYRMTLVTQAIQSSLFQTNAECCLEFAQAGLSNVS